MTEEWNRFHKARNALDKVPKVILWCVGKMIYPVLMTVIITCEKIVYYRDRKKRELDPQEKIANELWNSSAPHSD